MTITELVQKAHANAKEKGFHDLEHEFGTYIALLHSELSEALEADRSGDGDRVPEELADVVIRIADLCGKMGIDLEAAIEGKMKYNATRPRLHGKSY